MAGVHWHRVNEVLAAALEEHPDPRTAFLDKACAADASLRAEVESLLRAHGTAGTSIADPVPGKIELDDHQPDIGPRSREQETGSRKQGCLRDQGYI